jgi:hypothetical protein
MQQSNRRHSREGGNPQSDTNKVSAFKQIPAYARMTDHGYTMMIIAMAGFIVLFTAFALMKVGTLGEIQPDLSRIGIKTQPNSTPAAIAENTVDEGQNNQTQTPLTTNPENTLHTASSGIDEDAVDLNEGDNPRYIE